MKLITRMIPLLLLAIPSYPQAISLYGENDILSKTDQYYTHGTKITYHDDVLQDWCFPGYENTSLYLSQMIYTPNSIKEETPDITQRPYCGLLYLGASYDRQNVNYYEQINMAVGVVGPYSFSEQSQTQVHKWINDDLPQGWDHQVDTEPGIIFSYQRDYTYDLIDMDIVSLKAVPIAGGTAGNFFTFANAGGALFFGHNIKDRPMPVIVEPTNTLEDYMKSKSFRLYGLVGTEGRAILRNIALDGNIYDNEPSVEKKDFVYDIFYGFVAAFENVEVMFTKVQRSKEFDTQKEDASYNSVQLKYTF